MRTALIVAGVITGVLVTSIMVTASVWPTINRVETGKTLEYPELLPKTYQLGYDRVFDEVEAAAKAVTEGEPTRSDRAAGAVEFDTTMAVTGWTQHVRVTVIRRTEFVTRVSVSSEGTDAPGDLGQNARNIERYYASLGERLGAAEVAVKAK